MYLTLLLRRREPIRDLQRNTGKLKALECQWRGCDIFQWGVQHHLKTPRADKRYRNRLWKSAIDICIPVTLLSWRYPATLAKAINLKMQRIRARTNFWTTLLRTPHLPPSSIEIDDFVNLTLWNWKPDPIPLTRLKSQVLNPECLYQRAPLPTNQIRCQRSREALQRCGGGRPNHCWIRAHGVAPSLTHRPGSPPV